MVFALVNGMVACVVSAGIILVVFREKSTIPHKLFKFFITISVALVILGAVNLSMGVYLSKNVTEETQQYDNPAWHVYDGYTVYIDGEEVEDFDFGASNYYEDYDVSVSNIDKVVNLYTK